MTKKIEAIILSLLVAIVISVTICTVATVKYVESLDRQIARQKIEITVYRNELEKQQEIHAYLNNKNRELVGQNNFLESQNKMLMDKGAE